MVGQDETRYVPVAEAAVLLGVKPDSIRKRIRRRQLQAIKPPGSSEWLVLVDGTPPAPTGTAARQDSGRDIMVPPPEPPALGEWDALRRYHGTVLAGLVRVVERQDERHAAVMAELMALRGEVAALRDSAGPGQDTTRDGTRRSWWRRLLGLTVL
jgi:hypothetical protein